MNNMSDNDSSKQQIYNQEYNQNNQNWNQPSNNYYNPNDNQNRDPYQQNYPPPYGEFNEPYPYPQNSRPYQPRSPYPQNIPPNQPRGPYPQNIPPYQPRGYLPQNIPPNQYRGPYQQNYPSNQNNSYISNENMNNNQNLDNRYMYQNNQYNQNNSQIMKGQTYFTDQKTSIIINDTEESSKMEIAKKQMDQSNSFVFYFRFTYEFLEKLEKGALLFLADEKLNATLTSIQNKKMDEFTYFSCNILSNLYKKYLETKENKIPQANELKHINPIFPKPCDILLCTLFCLTSGAIVDASNQESSKFLLNLLITKKCSYPKFSLIPLFILINEESTEAESLPFLKNDSNQNIKEPPANKMDKDKRASFELYDTNYQAQVNGNINEFLNKVYSINANLNFIYFDIYVELENGTTKIRIFLERSLNIYIALYSTERPLETVLMALKPLLSQKAIQIKNSKITEKLKIAVEHSLESLSSQYNSSEFLISAIKLYEDYVLGVKYEIRVEKID